MRVQMMGILGAPNSLFIYVDFNHRILDLFTPWSSSTNIGIGPLIIKDLLPTFGHKK